MRTDAAGTSVTEIEAVPLTPSMVAVIVTVPVATPVTWPAPETVAIALLLVAHVTGRPMTSAPDASSASAARSSPVWMVPVGHDAHEETGRAFTETATRPDFPPALAAICVLPEPVPVMTPDCDTVATVASWVVQYTRRFRRRPPSASKTCAVIARVSPTVRATADGLTSTWSTSVSAGEKGSPQETASRT
jgi:hypothetical protein